MLFNIPPERSERFKFGFFGSLHMSVWSFSGWELWKGSGDKKIIETGLRITLEATGSLSSYHVTYIVPDRLT